jgi:hydrogenase/urease accessory protein HupE
VLDCGARGLSGNIGFDGLGGSVHRVVVQIVWLDGSTRAEIASSERPEIAVRGVGKDAGASELGALALAYGELGVEHIATGFDHLLFVVGLLLLVGFNRSLVWTITAFTAAHSITLALGVLGVLAVPRAPVEAVIALSILLVAVECLRPGPSLTRRAPWAVAFVFGLLHGFGFAGALSEIGLPPGQIPLALASFNIGVELGQLALIALGFAATRLVLGAGDRAKKLEKPLVYLTGTAAAFWTIERVVAMWSSA